MRRLLLLVLLAASFAANGQFYTSPHTPAYINNIVDSLVRPNVYKAATAGNVYELIANSSVNLLGSYANPSHITSLATSKLTGQVALTNGGTAANLSDPGANRLWGWDDTDNSIGFWTLGAGLSYDHATHTLSSSAAGARLLTGTSTFTGAVIDVGTTSNTFTYRVGSLGTTLSNVFMLENPTAATVGAQQISPPFVQRGSGWKTNATAGAQNVDFWQYVLPVQGAAAPTGQWVLAYSINGAGPTTAFTINTDHTVQLSSTAPSAPSNGSIWYNSSTIALLGRIAGTSRYITQSAAVTPGRIPFGDTGNGVSYNGMYTEISGFTFASNVLSVPGGVAITQSAAGIALAVSGNSQTFSGSGQGGINITGQTNGAAINGGQYSVINIANTLVTAANASQALIMVNGTPSFTFNSAIATGYGYYFAPVMAGSQLATTSVIALQNLTGAVAFSSVLTPAQITSNQNDYNPTGMSSGGAPYGSVINRLSTDASRTVTSISGGLSTGRFSIDMNVGSFPLVYENASASGTAASRFAMPGDAIIYPGQAVLRVYDGTTGRHRLVGTHHIFSSTVSGLTPVSPGGTATFLRSDAAWSNTIAAGTLADAATAFSVTATMPTVITATQYAISYAVGSAGSSAFQNGAFQTNYSAGYTGTNSTRAGLFANAAAGTSTTLVAASGSNGSLGNIGLAGDANATTVGTNIGLRGTGSGGDINVGLLGLSQVVKNGATNVGVVGSAINTGTTPVQVGGFFTLNRTTLPSTSAALIADNGTQTDYIFMARSNAATMLSIADEGLVTITPATLADGANGFAFTATQPTVMTGSQTAFTIGVTSAGSSAFSNSAFNVTYAAGYTGALANFATISTNSVAGTGVGLIGSGNAGNANYGLHGNANATTVGYNIGVKGRAEGGDVSAGVLGTAQVNKASATNIGVVGTALNGGASGVQIGGFFTLNRTTVPPVNAALIADNGSQADPIFLGRDAGSTMFSIGDAGIVSMTPSTLTDGVRGLTFTATQPTTITGSQYAVGYVVSSAGSSSFQNGAISVDYTAGYTGSQPTYGIISTNTVAGTGSALIGAAGSNTSAANIAFNGNANATTTGTNIGVKGRAEGGDVNAGGFFSAQVVKNGATNIGVAGTAINTGTTPAQIGGWFSLNRTTLPTVSAALIADNGAQTDPIFLARDAGTTVFSIVDGGAVTSTSTITATGVITTAFTTGYAAKTALYTLTNSDYTVEVTSGTHTQTLPTAVGIAGRIYVITNSGSGTVTVGTTSSQTFANVSGTPTTLTLTQFQSATVQSNGGNWLRVSTPTSLSLSNIVAATASSSIDNGSFNQTWKWNGITTNGGLHLRTESTGMTSGNSLIDISLFATNASSSITTIGLKVENQMSGTLSSNIGLLVRAASGAVNNIALDVGYGDIRLDNSSIKILDENENELFEFTHTASAVSNFRFANAAAGGSPSILAVGATNTILTLSGSGTGGVATEGTSTNDAAAAGYVGERMASTISTYANYTTTATYQAVTSITLTAGDWDVSAFLTYSSNSATITAASNAIFVISTTSASAAGSTEGVNIAYIPQAALLGTSKFSESIPPFRVSLAASTTYYLNTQATFTLGNPQYVGTIRATRIR